MSGEQKSLRARIIDVKVGGDNKNWKMMVEYTFFISNKPISQTPSNELASRILSKKPAICPPAIYDSLVSELKLRTPKSELPRQLGTSRENLNGLLANKKEIEETVRYWGYSKEECASIMKYAEELRKEY